MSGLMTRSPRSEREAEAPAPDAPAAEPAARTGVDLLSPWVHLELRVRVLRKRFGYALLALLVTVTGIWAYQQLLLREAVADLRGEEAVGSALGARVDDLAPVTEYVASVRSRSQLVHDTMWTEISHARVLDALSALLPAGTALDSVAVARPATAVDGASADATTDPATDPAADPTRGLVTVCPGPDPFTTTTVVACLDLSGTAPSRRVVADLVQALASEKLFVEPFISATTTDEASTVTFTGSVGIAPRAFTGRYDDLVESQEAPR